PVPLAVVLQRGLRTKPAQYEQAIADDGDIGRRERRWQRVERLPSLRLRVVGLGKRRLRRHVAAEHDDAIAESRSSRVKSGWTGHGSQRFPGPEAGIDIAGVPCVATRVRGGTTCVDRRTPQLARASAAR